MEEEDAKLVPMERVSSPQIAALVAQILKDAGVPAYVAGSLLQDEWAMSQKAMGLLGVEVQVPAEYLDEAREILKEAREAGKLLSEDSEPGSEPSEGIED